MKRQGPTQLERVARALLRHGHVSQLDFDSPTIDGLPPIRRVASRILDLRDAGWKINSHERRNAMAVYRLVSRPATPDSPGSLEPGLSAPAPAVLFEPPAPRPAGPYDDLEAAA